tara:strand:- start:360 stop:623 length:264 start_codon:yes stop_codon:yes gene_type:complete
MGNSTDQQAFGKAGALIAIPATGAVADEFCALQFLEDTILTTLTWPCLDVAAGEVGTGITYPAGFILYGEITGFTVTSGTVVAYKHA